MEKHHTTVRIPGYVINYCLEHNISFSELIMKGFDSFRATDTKHALSRLGYHEERVLHWKQIVLQNDNECGTKQQFCNTVRDVFREQGRGNKETKHEDMSWCEAKAESLLNKGVIVSKEELYNYCIKEV